MKLHLTAPCHFGLEKTLAFEVRRAGGEDVQVTDGRVNFSGTAETLVKASLTCSAAERIGVVIAKFKAQTFDDVFDNIKRLSAGDFFPQNAAFPVVKGQSINSKLTSIPALQRTLKKALAEAMSLAYKTKTLPESGALYPVRFFLHKDEFTVFLDSSGEGLHKRGYREKAGTAPIKETLAAGIIDIAKVRGNDIIIDPFCGSGTFLIEAALKALSIPPCLNRGFAAEKWEFIPQGLWGQQRELLRAGIKSDSEFMAYGYDSDPGAVKLTLENARKAGVEKYIKCEVRDIKDFSYPAKPCKIITNPPYAERMLEKVDTERIYKIMGEQFLPLGENKFYVITSDEKFEELFGQKAGKNRKLYNGMLMCRLYVY
ncbi:MAG: class I SAM-dependent RNA methyltransferase [Oscillospiraceae bacterium]|jgi:putative N6-adenine-specific DNA methylase|nr:class I SAM-dependent RNA methyltransferase [Oscillospiraceae bacterium]